MAGEARTRGACVSSVLCTRVLVCKAQRSERGRGSGEAKPGARHASLCAITQSRLSAMRAYTGIFLHVGALALFAQSVCPASALLRAAPCCSPFRAALTAAAWGASQCRHSQKPRSCKTEWKHLFLQHSRKRLAQLRSQLLCPRLAHSTPSPKPATRREAPATAARTTMAGHLTEQFQVLHGHLQAHIYNRRGRRSRSAKKVQAFSVRSWRSRSQHHLKHLPWLHLLHATMQHL